MGEIIAPWTDFLGQPIRHGDRLTHPDGNTFVAVRLDGHAHESDAWRAVYDNDPHAVSRLCLQIGDKGRAVLDQVATPRPAALTEEQEREAFEAWIAGLDGKEHKSTQRNPWGGYSAVWTGISWFAWLARASLGAPSSEEPICKSCKAIGAAYKIGKEAGASSEEQRDAADIPFRLRIARLLAELNGESVLSEQQCARYMGIDLLSWRELVHTFSVGTSFVEGEGDEIPRKTSEDVLRSAMASPSEKGETP